MELRQLKYFLAVAAELNFTRAAAQVGVAQPPLSQQILALERELGVQLFKRTKRSVSITSAGQELVVHANRLMMSFDQAAEMTRAVHLGKSGSLSIGAIYSSIYNFVPAVLRQFRKTHPDVTVSLQELSIAQQIQALSDGGIDLGILRGSVNNERLETVTLFSEPFVAAIADDHPLARKRVVSVPELARQPLVMISPLFNREFSVLMESLFSKHRDQLRIVQEVADPLTLLGLVSAGIGASLVPASYQSIRIQNIAYRPFKTATPLVTLKLAWHKDSVRPALPEFIRTAQAIGSDRGQWHPHGRFGNE